MQNSFAESTKEISCTFLRLSYFQSLKFELLCALHVCVGNQIISSTIFEEINRG